MVIVIITKLRKICHKGCVKPLETEGLPLLGGGGDGWREPVCLVLISSCWEGMGGDKGGENERIGSVLIEPKQRPTVRTRNTDL